MLWAVASAAELSGFRAVTFSEFEIADIKELEESRGPVFHLPGSPGKPDHFVALQWVADISALYMDNIRPFVQKLQPSIADGRSVRAVLVQASLVRTE